MVGNSVGYLDYLIERAAEKKKNRKPFSERIRGFADGVSGIWSNLIVRPITAPVRAAVAVTKWYGENVMPLQDALSKRAKDRKKFQDFEKYVSEGLPPHLAALKASVGNEYIAQYMTEQLTNQNRDMDPLTMIAMAAMKGGGEGANAGGLQNLLFMDYITGGRLFGNLGRRRTDEDRIPHNREKPRGETAEPNTVFIPNSSEYDAHSHYVGFDDEVDLETSAVDRRVAKPRSVDDVVSQKFDKTNLSGEYLGDNGLGYGVPLTFENTRGFYGCASSVPFSRIDDRTYIPEAEGELG